PVIVAPIISSKSRVNANKSTILLRNRSDSVWPAFGATSKKDEEDSGPESVAKIAKLKEVNTMLTAAAPAILPSTPQIEGANFLNLLIVDDDRAIREACREVAQSLGFNTLVADSAEQAYRILDTQGIDAVLLD